MVEITNHPGKYQAESILLAYVVKVATIEVRTAIYMIVYSY